MSSRVPAGASVLALAAGSLTGCAVTPGQAGSPAGPGPLTDLQMLVPQGPGSGFDVTARAVVKTLADLDLATGTEVTNLPGASGTVGLARTIREDDNGRFLLVIGPGLGGAADTDQADPTVTGPK